jgi:hypothetical protein
MKLLSLLTLASSVFAAPLQAPAAAQALEDYYIFLKPGAGKDLEARSPAVQRSEAVSTSFGVEVDEENLLDLNGQTLIITSVTKDKAEALKQDDRVSSLTSLSTYPLLENC